MSACPGLTSGTTSPTTPLRVVVVGAGISGILLAIKLQQSIHSLGLVIYEKNPEIGGTWWENRYPGCACDIPAHTYQLSFESNHAWSTFYASAGEILEYWKRVADKYNVRRYVKFRHRLSNAQWNPTTLKWEVSVHDEARGVTIHQHCDVLITAMGVLNQWDWPSIPGLHDFKGKLMHSADWDQTYNVKGKRVAVIGAGSSGIQIVPAIQPEVEQLDHYVRGRTWIASPFASEEVDKRGATAGNFHYSTEEIKTWEKDPAAYLRYRKQLENAIQSGYEVTAKGSPVHEGATKAFKHLMAGRLEQRPDLLDNLVPAFAPFCKRLTPGPGYLEALCKPNVDVAFQHIERVTETGILTKDGTHREVDTIICATGFNTTYNDRFPIFGLGGQKLFEKRPDGGSRLSTYLSLAVDNFPNFFMMLGPNSGVGHGNLLIILEQVASYCTRALRKLQREGITTIQPTTESVERFTSFCDRFFEGRVFSDECSSWYKADGRVSALWPGSSLHAVESLAMPRWEDFQYTYSHGDRSAWLGNGTTAADNNPGADRSYYLAMSQSQPSI